MPLQDSDNFIIGRGTDSYKITYEDLKDDLNYVPPPVGTIDQPTVLEPNDGEGSGSSTYAKSSAITNIEGGGTVDCETELINNVDTVSEAPNVVLSFPTNKDFACFSPGEVVQGTAASAVVTTNNPNGFQSGRGPENILSGDKTTRCDLASSNTGDFQYGIFVDIEALLGPNYMGQLTIYTNYNTASADGDRYKFYVVYADNTESAKVNFNTGGGWKTVVSAGSKAIKYIVATAIDGRTPGLWTAIGTASNDSSIITGDPEVKVVSKDPSANPPTITVDGGTWVAANQSQEWSANRSYTGSEPAADQLAPVGFNGSTSYTDGYVYAVQGGTQTVTFNLPFTKLEVWTWNHVPGNGELEINDTSVSQEISDDPDAKDFFDGGFKVDATTLVTSPLTSIKAIKTATGTSGGFTAVYVDGKMLVDISANVATKLSKTTPFDTKLTFADATDLDEMSGEVFMTDGANTGSGFTQTPKLLQTTAIDSVSADNAWNQSQTWSGNVTGTVNEIDAAFNGNNNQNYAYATSANSFTVNFSPAISGSMRILGGTYAALVNATQCVATSSDGKVFPIGANPYDNQDWTPAQTVTNCTSLAFTTVLNTGISLTAIELNGKQLVDTGVAGDPGNGILLTFPGDVSTNPDLEYFEAGDELIAAVAQQVSGVTNNVQDHGVSNSTVLLDGSSPINSGTTLTPLYNYLGAGGRDGSATISFVPPLKASGGQTIWVNLFSQPNGGGFKVNVNTPDESELTFAKNSTWQFVHTNKTEISNIQFTGRTGTSGIVSGIQLFSTSNDGSGRFTMPDPSPAVNVVSVDTTTNTMIVDEDGFSAGDVVEYQTKGGKGTVVSVDTSNNTMLVTNSADRDERWIKNYSVTDNSLVIDDPLLTNDVQLRGSDFATTPPDADTLKEIIWDINGVEYSAGVTNPWSPLEKLPTNSTVTVKVKYKGNVLEDSIWSPTVTFTTGATLRSLFIRIAALEANDVTDDATDTALITLIAGLAQRIQALEESN